MWDSDEIFSRTTVKFRENERVTDKKASAFENLHKNNEANAAVERRIAFRVPVNGRTSNPIENEKRMIFTYVLVDLRRVFIPRPDYRTKKTGFQGFVPTSIKSPLGWVINKAKSFIMSGSVFFSNT